MIRNFILLVCFIQFCLYALSDILGYKKGKQIISVLVIVGIMFVFPSFFMPPDTGKTDAEWHR